MKSSFKTEVKEVSKEVDDFIFIKTDGKNNFEKVQINEICYIEGLKNYVAIHLKDRQVITNNTLKSIEDFLPTSDFVKTHKSFIVSLRHITKTDSLNVLSGHVDPQILLIKKSPEAQLVQDIALVSQFTQGEVQGAQILLKESLNVLSGHDVPQIFLLRKSPEEQLVQVVAFISQLTHGELQEEQLCLISSLNVLSGHTVPQVLLVKKLPGPQLVQCVGLISQFTQGEVQGAQRLLEES